MTSNDRYARQLLIEGWDQQRLRKARLLVAGVGALGNEVLKNLALLGAGNLLLVDFDRVELSNLSRTVLFDESDVGRPKAAAAAKALSRLNPDVKVETIDGDLFYHVGLGRYRHSDLVVGCLDNLAARSQVGLSCRLAGTPYLDGGMWSMGGEVRWFTAGEGPCFDCTLSKDDWGRAQQRRSCSGFRSTATDEPVQVATVVSTAAIIGGLLAQEAVKWICGHPVTKGKAIVYNGQALTLHRSEIARTPDCRSSHSAYENVIELPERAAELSPRRLLAIARDGPGSQDRSESEPAASCGAPAGQPLILELGRDFLSAVDCPECGHCREINRATGLVAEDELVCPRCGATGRAEPVRSIDQSSPYADHPLSDLGVPPGEVLAVHSATELRLYELTADLESA